MQQFLFIQPYSFNCFYSVVWFPVYHYVGPILRLSHKAQQLTVKYPFPLHYLQCQLHVSDYAIRSSGSRISTYIMRPALWRTLQSVLRICSVIIHVIYLNSSSFMIQSCLPCYVRTYSLVVCYTSQLLSHRCSQLYYIAIMMAINLVLNAKARISAMVLLLLLLLLQEQGNLAIYCSYSYTHTYMYIFNYYTQQACSVALSVVNYLWLASQLCRHCLQCID